jgi:serine/threonine protein kinase/TPR repeat protein
MEARPTSHPSAESLRALALGKLDDNTASEVLSHLDVCPDCSKEVTAATNDDFLNRLRQVHTPSGTPAPAKPLAKGVVGTQPGAVPTTLHNVPPELADYSQYEVLRELGRGGMGVVYLAKNKMMDRLEVLKVVNKALLNQPGAVERFLREIRSAAKLNHPNVVAAYSALQLGDLLAFAMEYVEGEDLHALVKARGPLPVVNACHYVQQAAIGLQHAFEKGMVHRDIKPQNLILAREGKKHIIKVLDFGLAKATREKSADTELTGEGQMLGTPDFMAPEQTMDAAKADIRADIYSLGCTLYFLLTAGPPFRGKSLGAVLLAHQSTQAQPLNLVRADVPEELAAAVRKMMAKEPAQRYQTPADVVKALATAGRPSAKGASSKSSLPTPAPAARSEEEKRLLRAETILPPPEAAQATMRGPGTVPVPAGNILSAKTILPVEARPVQGGNKPRPPAVQSSGAMKWGKWLLLGIAAVLLASGAIGWRSWRSGSPKTDPEPRRDRDDSRVVVRTADYSPPSEPEREPTPDPELQTDWDDSSRVVMTTGSSLPFYQERGPKRIQAWKRAAESRNPMGMYMYARCLSEGTGVAKDESEAFKWYRKAAALGNARAMNAVGFCYDRGDVVTKDPAEAIRWYRRAADLRETTAMTNLASCYLNGTGLAKNESEALKLFRAAADLGDSRAMRSLGECYQFGSGVAKDDKAAVEWYRKAAERGNGEALYNLGECYQNGYGVAKDEKEAVEWYRKAADVQSMNGMIRLAERMIDGDAFVRRSPAEALTLLNQALAIQSSRGSPIHSIREHLARAALRAGQDDLRATRHDEARTHLTAARTVSVALNKERPGRFYYMQDLGQTWFEFGNLERAEGNARVAADCYRKAMAVDGPEMTKATQALAELHEKGEGVVKDEAKAKELRALFAKQKIKRFTIPCKIGGSTFPVHVYVFEVFPWRHPLETQFCYFKEERGFDLPKDVMDSFERLHKISKENNVSFTDLCVYALGDKKDEKKDKK